MGSDGLIF